MKAKVLIGVGTFENFDYIEKHSLPKIFSQSYENFDVLIVDSSKDIAHFMNLKKNYPSAIIHHFNRPVFFRDALCKTRQFIVDYAVNYGYDFLFFVDVDHILEPDTLSKLISHDKDFVTAQIGYLHKDYSTCYIRDLKETKPSYVPGMPPLKAIWYEEMKKPPFFIEIDACGLACALVKTRVLMGISFFITHKQAAFMEDLIFCSDLKKKGIKLFLDKTIKPFHAHVMMASRSLRDF